MVQDLVSIITPCYNGGKFIAETIESVLSQTYPNWEMLIIDDGSEDNSRQIIESYAVREKRIQYYYQENAGSAAARNYGIHRANGQYIALLDADDIWISSFLEKQIAFMKAKSAICVCCAYSKIDASSKEILRPEKPLNVIREEDMMVMNRIGCLSGLYDSEKYGKIYLREDLRSIRDDYAYWIDIVKLEGVAYGNPEILAKYRILNDSTTGNKKKLIKKQYAFYRKYLKQSFIQSSINVLRWGFSGIIKFYR